MSDTQDLIDRLVEYVEGETTDLSDMDYVEVLEGVSSILDSSVAAKRSEMD